MCPLTFSVHFLWALRWCLPCDHVCVVLGLLRRKVLLLAGDKNKTVIQWFKNSFQRTEKICTPLMFLHPSPHLLSPSEREIFFKNCLGTHRISIKHKHSRLIHGGVRRSAAALRGELSERLDVSFHSARA